jgi:hypothetical protein
MWYLNLEKTFISQHILHQHWYTCPITLPVRRNSQQRSLLTVVSATSTPPFQPLRHQRNVCHQCGFFSRPNRWKSLGPTVNRKYSLWIAFACSSLATKNSQQNVALQQHTPQAKSPFWLLNPASEHVCLLPRLSWSWTVLLPSDTNIKPITSITAVLLPFVTYVLILPRNYTYKKYVYENMF